MNPPNSRTARWAVRLAPFLAALAALLAFLPALRCGFVAWDDPQVFLSNPHYRGLGWSNLWWMLTTVHMGNYQPLTWLSLALDYQLWGMDPFGYHLGSVLLHSANAGLFCLLCLRLTAAEAEAPGWPWAAAALLGSLTWALHPLRVESVAWATERKDVLSTFFYLATLLCHLRWTEGEDRRWRGAALAAYGLSLLSKAMGMTLPLALLILDVYPLRRRPRRGEKLPFFVLAAAAAAAGYWGQTSAKAAMSWADLGGLERLARAAYAAAFYLVKTAAPWGLSPFYEMHLPLNPLAPMFVVSALALGMLAALLCLWRRRAPGLAAAAGFYAVSVSPVLGLVAVGSHLAADRYTYIPSLGFSVLAAGFLLGLLGRPRLRTPALAVSGALVLGLAALSWRQCGFWRDSASLWGRVLALAPATAAAHHNLATELAGKGDYAAAALRYRRALILQPHSPLVREGLKEVLYNGANAALRSGRLPEAERLFRQVLALAPDFAEAYNNLGLALAAQGRQAEACAQYAQALRLRPEFAAAHHNLGNSLSELGRLPAAEGEFRRAVQIDGALLDARFNLANTLARQGRWAEAANQYRAVLLRAPGFPGARENLAKVRRLGG